MNTEFTKNITDEIDQYSCIEYGCIGTEYLYILTIKDNRIVPVGEFLYQCWREQSTKRTTLKILKQLGVQAQKYINGEREKMPSVHYVDNELTLV